MVPAIIYHCNAVSVPIPNRLIDKLLRPLVIAPTIRQKGDIKLN